VALVNVVQGVAVGVGVRIERVLRRASSSAPLPTLLSWPGIRRKSAVRLGVAGPDRPVAGHVRASDPHPFPGTDEASQIADALATAAPTAQRRP
jgi:hypothetical protein